MDNLTFEKIWQEDGLIELKITAKSKFVWAYQNCYIQDSDLRDISNKMLEYANNKEKKCYLQMGNKEGNFTPVFSMELEKIDLLGHIRIEVDLEIEDNDARKHRCCFYVGSALGAIERLGDGLNKLINDKINSKIELSL